MSRFAYLDDEGGMPWAMWEQVVSRALASQRGQRALAEMEEALVALPEQKLVEGVLASEDGVCAVGALVAHKRAKQEGLDMAAAIEATAARQAEDVYETVEAGERAGLRYSVAWHLAHLNDETFREATPEQRYEKILAWVRCAQGKTVVA